MQYHRNIFNAGYKRIREIMSTKIHAWCTVYTVVQVGYEKQNKKDRYQKSRYSAVRKKWDT